jgi:glycosyltransferase involved in cell wall biosynthesis
MIQPLSPHRAPGKDRRTGEQPPIRMLHVITRLIRGGADENTLHTVRGLDPRRYEVDLVVGAGSELGLLQGLEHVGLHFLPALVRDPHPFKDVIALLQLARLMRGRRYQIVHTHTAKGGFLGRIAAAMVGTPTIVHTLHGVTFHEHLGWAERAFYLALERLAGRFTHQFVSVGEDVKRIYLGEAIGRPEAYETIYSGMPLDQYLAAGEMTDIERAAVRAELALTPRHQVVAMAARLEARKGHAYLLEATRRLKDRHPELRVLVVGDGPLRAALEAQARAFGLEEVVRFLGHRLDLSRVLAAADVSVLTSLWEGLPRVLVQSAAAGRPILTFDVEGAWEVVRDGENGFIVPSRDVDAFTARLDRLLRDRALARSLGQAGRERVSAVWTVETMLERLDLMYQRLASKQRAA